MIIPLELVVDDTELRKAYDDYALDYAWYMENDPSKLASHPPSSEYALGGPEPFEKWADGWVIGILDEVLESKWSHTVRRVETSPPAVAGQPQEGGGRSDA